MTDRPTDLAIVAVMLLDGREWMYADEIRGALARLGFAPTGQRVAAQLRRMGGESCPGVESRTRWGPTREYRLTGFGFTWARNTWDGVRTRMDSTDAPDWAKAILARRANYERGES